MKFNKIFAVPALTLALAAGLWSCTDEAEYTEAQPESNAEVYFPSTSPGTISLALDQNSFDLTLYRGTTSGSVTAALSATQTADGQPCSIFSVPDAVTFADGSNTAVVTVNFDFSNIVANTSYSVTVDIDNAAATEYGKRTQTVAVKYAPWSAWQKSKEDGVYTFVQAYNGSYYVTLLERKNLLDTNIVEYKIPGEDEDENAPYTNALVITLDKSTNAVTVAPQNLGIKVNTGEGPLPSWVADSYTAYTEVFNASKLTPPADPNDFKDASFFDPKTGVLTLSLVYYIPSPTGGAYMWARDVIEFLALPGYPDYSLNFANNGTKIGEDGTEYAVVTIAKGDDVANYALAIVKGALTDEQIEEVADQIKADTDITLYSEGGNFNFKMTSDGYYTIVGVTYDEKGIATGVQSHIFNYEMTQKDWNAGWTSLGKRLYTDYFIWTKPSTWEVELQESKKYPGYYRLVKPYAYGICPNTGEGESERGHFYTYIDATDPDAVMIEMSETSLGYIIMSYNAYLTAIGKPANPALFGTYHADGDSITMPAESLCFAMGDRLYGLYPEEGPVTILKPKKVEEDPGDDRPASGNAGSYIPLRALNTEIGVVYSTAGIRQVSQANPDRNAPKVRTGNKPGQLMR